MKVLLFQPQFAAAVAAGKKRQTIRPLRKRPVRVGDELSLRQWSGDPYRSKQKLLLGAVFPRLKTVCTNIIPVHIHADGISIDEKMDATGLTTNDDFARQDGFADFPEMKAWFEKNHGLPFSGVVITWCFQEKEKT